MAGFFGSMFNGDNSQGSPSAGVLGQVQQGDSNNTLGLIGATLGDISAHLAGKPQDATNLATFKQNNAQRQLLQSLTSSDPAVRQQAYAIAPAYGIDPSQFQKAQANAAAPQLLSALNTPTQQVAPVTVTPQVSAQVPLNDPSRAAAAQSGISAPSLSDALQSVGNPELTAQYAPKIIDDQEARQKTQLRQLSPSEAVAAGYKATDPVYKNDYTNQITSVVKPQAEIQQTFDVAKNTPRTQEDIAKDSISRESANAAMISANKPQFVPYGTTAMVQGGKVVQIPGGGTGSPFGNGDPKAASINGQTGLSTAGYNYLTGNTSQLGTRDKQQASREVDGFIARSGLDPTVVKPKVQALQSAVNINTLKANTIDTLGKEITGTVQNYAPIIDKLTGNGNVRLINNAYQLVGSAVNDPTAQQAVVYLNQMRADLAGFNAASGGKIGVHGQVSTDNGDFAKADEVIKNGLSSGGARAIAQAIDATRQKNVAIANQQSLDAQKGIWTTLGVGQNFDATHPNAAAPKGAPDPNNLPRVAPISKTIGGKIYSSPDGGKTWYQ